MDKWARIDWDGGNMTGPAEAIKVVAEDFDAKGIDYTIKAVRLGKPKATAKKTAAKRTTKKKVADVDLEVRGVPMPGGNDGGGSDAGGTTPTP